jgi:uncharacterized protein (TIGR03546 family)
MLTLVNLIQSLVKALNSEGTPGQVAAGIALGAMFGLTPLVNLHNLLMLAAIFLLNVSLPGAFVGWVVFLPLGFAMDPVFHAVGERLLLDTPALTGWWTTVYNTPVLALANLTNTIVIGSLLGWLVLSIPIYFGARWAVGRYRATVYTRLKDSRLFKAVQASKAYNVYRMFRP